MLAGAGMADAGEGETDVQYVHTTARALITKPSTGNDYVIELDSDSFDGNGAFIVDGKRPLYGTILDAQGNAAVAYTPAIDESYISVKNVGATTYSSYGAGPSLAATSFVGTKGLKITVPGTGQPSNAQAGAGLQSQLQSYEGHVIVLDFYMAYIENVKAMIISPEKFGGYYYIEASSLIRDESTGQDLPAELIIPRGKIQSNFTLSMSNSGDPSEKFMRMAA